MKRQARANKEKETFEGKGYNDKLERAKFFECVLENMHEGVFVLKLDSTILFANEQAAKLLGLQSAHESLGKKSLSFVHPDSQDLVRKNLERIIKRGEDRLRNLFRMKDIAGEETWVETCGTRIDFKGQPADLVTCRNVTDRKKAEERLRESEEQFRLLVEGPTDYAIFMLDLDGNVSSWNKGAENIKGYRPEEIIGKHFSVFYSDEDIQSGKPERRLKIARDKGRCEEEGWRVRKDGSHFWASVVITGLYDKAGKFYGFSKIVRDISERKRAEEKIKALSRFPSENPNPVLRIARDGKVIYANDAGKEVFKVQVGKKMPERYLPILKKATSSKEYVSFEEQIGHRYFSSVARAIPKTDYLNMYSRDITERKKVEEKFKESEKRFRRLFEQSNDAVFIHGLDGRILNVNSRACEMLGYDKDTLLQMSIPALHPQEEFPRSKKAFEITKDKASVRFESKFKKAGGTIINVDISSRIVDPEKGVIQGIARDITKRKQAEQVLRESESKYRSLFENMLDGFAYCKILLDDNNRPTDFVYLEVNDAFERLTGLKKEDVVGKKATEAIPGIKDSHPELFDVYGKVALTGKEVKFDIYFEPLEIWLSISVYSPTKGYFVAIFDNITEQKKAEEKLQQYSENLEQMVEERTKKLRDVQEELVRSERLATLGQVSGGISHELRNPLGVIDSSAYYLKMKLKDTDPKVREHLDRIRSAVGKATGIIESLLKMTQMREPWLKELDLIAVTSKVIGAFKMPVAVKLVENFPKGELTVRIDRGQLEIVIEDIINNAIQAMGGKGTLTVGISRTADGQAEVTIADTGPGIAADILDTIFDPLFSTKEQGVGLGLSIARAIVDKHSGSIEVKSKPGEGTILIIRLPLHREKDKEG